MKKNAKLKFTKKWNSKIFFIILSTAVGLIVFKLFFLSPKNIFFFNKKNNSTVAQKSFIITNESGSIRKEIPIKPASVGNIKFEQKLQHTSVPTHTPQAIQPPSQGNKNYDYLYQPIDSADKIYHIDIDAAKFLFDSGKAIFVDARNPVEYKEAHIKGAVSIPTNATPEEINKLKDVLKGKILVIYCHGIGCHLSDKVAYKLFDMGYRNIAIFFSGWQKWEEYNYPIEK